jgi:hypothetical protein
MNVTPSMLLLLLAWLCGPAILVTLGVEVWQFQRRGVFRSGRTARAIFALLLTVVAVPVFAILFAWIAPGWLFRWPVVHDYPVPPIFFPAILGCFIIAPLLIRWAAQKTTT